MNAPVATLSGRLDGRNRKCIERILLTDDVARGTCVHARSRGEISSRSGTSGRRIELQKDRPCRRSVTGGQMPAVSCRRGGALGSPVFAGRSRTPVANCSVAWPPAPVPGSPMRAPDASLQIARPNSLQGSLQNSRARWETSCYPSVVPVPPRVKGTVGQGPKKTMHEAGPIRQPGCSQARHFEDCSDRGRAALRTHTSGILDTVDLPELLVADAAAWRFWLRAQHSRSQGVWLVLAKKSTAHPTTLTYEEALDEAICFGWIDGQLGRRDNATFRRRFTPRNARSAWSQRNVAIAERLSRSGRMHQSGEEEVRQAKADGRWKAAYPGQAGAEVPEDLAKALIANPRAQAMFQTLTSANRYSILYRIGNAKKIETRARRIEQLVEMLSRGETIHPQVARSPER